MAKATRPRMPDGPPTTNKVTKVVVATDLPAVFKSIVYYLVVDVTGTINFTTRDGTAITGYPAIAGQKIEVDVASITAASAPVLNIFVHQIGG